MSGPAAELAGQGAVVTGGAQGFGLAVALQLAKRGARVALWDIDEQELAKAQEQIGSGTLACVADVADWPAVQRAWQRSVAELGQVHALVNNAGISGPNAPTVDYPVEAWRQVLQTDLDSVFFCCKAALPHMRERGYGRVVNIASIAGKEGNPNAPAYSAAKAGVIALTKTLGKEFADCDVAVNCVTPAAAKTRIFAQMSPQHIEYMLSKVPRGRFLRVDELAALVGWLVSPSNSFATGAVFDISGGRATY